MPKYISDRSNTPIFKPTEGIFNQRQLSEILYSLEGKQEIPRKYGYFGVGVEKWSNKSISGMEQLLAHSDGKKFNMFIAQYEMIRKTIDVALGAIPEHVKINLVDVGCGNGFPVYPVLKYIQDRKQLAKYIAIDIVPEMCDLAIKNLTGPNGIKNLKTVKCVHDFEDGHFADTLLKERDVDTVNLFCFFSNTLGTMVDGHRALANIRDSMTEGDLLWIGNTLFNNALALETFYNSLEINSDLYKYYHGDALSFFESFNMDWWDFGHVQVKQSDYNGLLKYYFTVTKSFILEIPKIEKQDPVQIEFNEGAEIVFVRLKNYTETDLIGELKEAGFKIKLLNVSDDYRAALVLVSVN